MRFLFFLFTVLTCNVSAQSEEYKKLLDKYYDGFPTISVEEASKKIDESDVIFIDTREVDEYNIGHIKSARCVGFDNFSLNSVKNISKSSEIIIYCSIGARSQEIGKKLKKAGYSNVKNLYGGLFHWSNKGLPMVDRWNNNTRNIHGYSKEWGKWVSKGNVVY